jgi:hypothetical protein
VAGEVALHLEADAVIVDFDSYTFGIAGPLYSHDGRAGVFEGIVEGFLDHAIIGLLRL